MGKLRAIPRSANRRLYDLQKYNLPIWAVSRLGSLLTCSTALPWLGIAILAICERIIHLSLVPANFGQHLICYVVELQDHVQDDILLGARHHHRLLLHALGCAHRTRSYVLTVGSVRDFHHELHPLEARYAPFCAQSSPLLRRSFNILRRIA